MSEKMKTYSAKPADIKHDWHLIDAQGVVLGRLASYVAKILRGKHKATYTPHMDCGDHVVIVNADKVKLTGRKKSNKIYYRHTGFPGGIKSATPEYLEQEGKSERVLQKAVERMITRNPLGRKQLRKLHVYKGAEHPHTAQQPAVIDFAAMNEKNAR
jgi:large subunit ribosomal protein L13